MGSIQAPKLFEPLRVGEMELSHRVVMSPLTRIRCPSSLPNELVAEYYAQRTTPGGLIIGEGTHPSIMVCSPSFPIPKSNVNRTFIKGGNFLNVPGIFTPEHILAWKLVTDAVHAKGGYMVCQLWHVSLSLRTHCIWHQKSDIPKCRLAASQYLFNSADVSL
jgi:N-ethylmaleimide reductase